MKHPVTLYSLPNGKISTIMVTLDEETSEKLKEIENTYGLTVSTEKLRTDEGATYLEHPGHGDYDLMVTPTHTEEEIVQAIKEMVARFDAERYAKWLMWQEGM